jgi:hypothetical protein
LAKALWVIAVNDKQRIPVFVEVGITGSDDGKTVSASRLERLKPALFTYIVTARYRVVAGCEKTTNPSGAPASSFTASERSIGV